jgi:hypothetical protein
MISVGLELARALFTCALARRTLSRGVCWNPIFGAVSRLAGTPDGLIAAAMATWRGGWDNCLQLHFLALSPGPIYTYTLLRIQANARGLNFYI